MDKKKRSLEDIFILQQLQKIKDAKYYTSPIFTPEEWKQRYPHESVAEIPSYIPCWRDLDEIIYSKMQEAEDELGKKQAKISKRKEASKLLPEVKVIYLDEQLPPVNETFVLVIVEVDHGESTDSELEIYQDHGGRYEDGTWWTTRNWDEGGPWAIVGWIPKPKLPDKPTEEEIRKHKIDWINKEEK